MLGIVALFGTVALFEIVALVWNRRFGLESSLRLESSLGNVVALRNRRLSPPDFHEFLWFQKSTNFDTNGTPYFS